MQYKTQNIKKCPNKLNCPKKTIYLTSQILDLKIDLLRTYLFKRIKTQRLCKYSEINSKADLYE